VTRFHRVATTKFLNCLLSLFRRYSKILFSWYNLVSPAGRFVSNILLLRGIMLFLSTLCCQTLKPYMLLLRVNCVAQFQELMPLK